MPRCISLYLPISPYISYLTHRMYRALVVSRVAESERSEARNDANTGKG